MKKYEAPGGETHPEESGGVEDFSLPFGPFSWIRIHCFFLGLILTWFIMAAFTVESYINGGN